MGNLGRVLVVLVVAVASYAAGSASSKASKKKSYNTGYRKGATRSKARFDQRLEKLNNKMEQFVGEIKEREKFFDAVIAMMAIGISAANSDGEIDDKERESVAQFVAGVSAADLPSRVKSKIEEMYNSPPNLQTAHSLAQRANVPSELSEEVIEVVIHADGVKRRDERAFLAAWRSMKPAA